MENKQDYLVFIETYGFEGDEEKHLILLTSDGLKHLQTHTELMKYLVESLATKVELHGFFYGVKDWNNPRIENADGFIPYHSVTSIQKIKNLN